MTLMAFANALGSLIGPVLFGFILDMSGGRQEPFAWGLAFLALGVCMAIGAETLRRGVAARSGDQGGAYGHGHKYPHIFQRYVA